MEEGMAKGMEKGLAKGMEEGMEKGLNQGISQGIKEGRAEILRKLYSKGNSIQDIAAMLQMPEQEVRELCEGNLSDSENEY